MTFQNQFDPARHTRRTASGPPDETRPRCLVIVEDSAPCVTVLEIALNGLTGIRLEIFRRAEDAFSMISRDSEALCCGLVTDVHLPGMDGFQLVREVRELKPAGTFPIMVMTGDTDPETPELALRLGADAYFRKPYSPKEVRRKLEELLDDIHNPNLPA